MPRPATTDAIEHEVRERGDYFPDELVYWRSNLRQLWGELQTDGANLLVLAERPQFDDPPHAFVLDDAALVAVALEV